MVKQLTNEPEYNIQIANASWLSKYPDSNHKLSTKKTNPPKKDKDSPLINK